MWKNSSSMSSMRNNENNYYSSSTTTTTRRRKIRVVMLPWLAHGHITPFIELSKKLVRSGGGNFKIYICSTAAALEGRISTENSKEIEAIELKLPETEELPAALHTTNGLPPKLMDSLKKAFEKGGKKEFEGILKKNKPDMVIYDALQPWAPEAASKLGIPAVHFIANAVTMSAFMFNASNDPYSRFPFPEIYYRDYERDIEDTNKKLERCPTDYKRNLVTECFQRSSTIVLIKSISDIESKYIHYLSDLSGKKVLPIGPLVPTSAPIPGPCGGDDEITEWLNKKEKRSTVYVAFGSEYFLDQQDMLSIAKGLELSGVNFIWVIRSPKGVVLDLEQALPKGFLQRLVLRASPKGKIILGWAPQAQILSHPSIGGFVSHCGWSSVMESINFGVPIIAVPMQLDQPINARLVQHVGIGVEAVKDQNNKIQSEELAKQIRTVVLENNIQGEKVRSRVELMKKKIEEKGDDDIDMVAYELLQLVRGRHDALWELNIIITKIVAFLKFLF